jgi:hypothetical protein
MKAQKRKDNNRPAVNGIAAETGTGNGSGRTREKDGEYA